MDTSTRVTGYLHDSDTTNTSNAEIDQPDTAQQLPNGCPDSDSNQVFPSKVALVTGSGSGIGACIALDLVVAGYHVIVTGRTEEKLLKVTEQCNSISPSSASLFVVDLNNLEQVDRLIQFVRLKFNRLDVLVNNVCWRGKVKNILAEEAYEDMLSVMHLNVSVPMYLIHKCLIPLRCKNLANMSVLVNISSIAGREVVPLHLYSISKACLTELTTQIASISHDLDISCVNISPGPVLTPERPHHIAMSGMTLMKRVARPQEISNLVMFSIQNANIFNGQDLVVDGGYSVKQKHQSNRTTTMHEYHT